MKKTNVAVAVLAVAGITGATVYQVVPGAATRNVPPLKTGWVTGTVLSMYNTPSTFAGTKRGFAEQNFRLFRFPNGSMSNWYHWNGAGSYDSAGVWHPDSTKILPGTLTNSRYRGTTNAGSSFASLITDGVDSTFWWSDPLGAAQPWVQLGFKGDSAVDSVRIAWGALRPDSVVVGMLSTSFWNGFGGMDSKLVPLATVAVTGASTEVKFASTKMKFLVVKPVGIKAEGVQIGEVAAWSAGSKVTVNSKSATAQTAVTAMGAHPGNDVSPNWTTPPSWTFATYLDYIATLPGAEALICVNYGTGTAEEAAAWVKYANVDKKLGIKYWEIGNEMDGYWEEGGPVTATQYANKYLAYARAMKKVDPSILVFGPVMSTSEFSSAPSGNLDGLTWTEEVLRIVGEAEIKDGVRYLDGFDFHAYPYWTDSKPTATAALRAIQELKPRLDTLSAMMSRRLQDAGSRLVNMSEINMSVVSMDLLVRPENATGIALALSELVEANGGNSMSIVWEGFNGGGTGSADNGGTWGALSLFADPRSGTVSSEKAVPTAAYWGNWMVSKAWAIDSAKPLPATVSGAGNIEARALVSGADTSWLLLNLSPRVCSTQVSNFSSGWIYTFSKTQYTWNGSSDQAYAFPNAGPSGMPIPAGWNHVVAIPAYGMAVVRNKPAGAPTADHVVNLTLLKKQIESGDTVKVSGTILRAPAGAVPVIGIGDTSVTLQAIDGAWDADQEGFVASIPVDALGQPGVKKVRIGSDSIEFTVTGKIRPNLWIDRFNDQAMASEQPSKAKWFSWHADESEDSSAWNMGFVERAGNTYALRTDVRLVQPADLGYTVAGFTGLLLDSVLVSNSLGLQFEYASWHSNKTAGAFSLGVSTDTVKDYQDYSYNLQKTDSTWKTVRLLWSQFSQPSWAKPCGPLLARQINQLNFRITGEGKASLWIDNIALLGTSGDSVSGVRGRVRAASWNVRRVGADWRIDAPEGTRVQMIGIDGRRLERLVVPASGTASWSPRGTGVVYMVLESSGLRDVKVLPALR